MRLKPTREEGEAEWRRIEAEAGFELPDDCECCASITNDKCHFKKCYQNVLKFVCKEAIIKDNVGHGRRFSSVQNLRYRVYRVVANDIQDQEESHGRIILPNCVTSGIRGILCGNDVAPASFSPYKFCVVQDCKTSFFLVKNAVLPRRTRSHDRVRKILVKCF